jgi:hypothetical protein
MRIGRAQREGGPLQVGMRNDGCDDSHAIPSAPEIRVHEDILQMGGGGAVRDDPGEGDLAIREIAPEAQRVGDGPLEDFATDTSRPIGFLPQMVAGRKVSGM